MVQTLRGHKGDKVKINTQNQRMERKRLAELKPMLKARLKKEITDAEYSNFKQIIDKKYEQKTKKHHKQDMD